LNYREKLWSVWGGQALAREVMNRIAQHVDVLLGDFEKGLGIPGLEIEGRSRLDPAVFQNMMDCVTKRFPRVRAIATTLREVHSAGRHSWSAMAWVNGESYTAPVAELEIYDRVGGGDGFASGFFYGLLTGASVEEAVRLGWAHGALLTTFPGDTTMASLEQVKAFAQCGSCQIQR
jgi:2-dehydro-3-deoxygluconokinase